MCVCGVDEDWVVERSYGRPCACAILVDGGWCGRIRDEGGRPKIMGAEGGRGGRVGDGVCVCVVRLTTDSD